MNDDLRQTESAKERLVQEFSGTVAAETVRATFDAVVSAYAEAPVKAFVPVLATREVRQTLRRPLVGS